MTQFLNKLLKLIPFSLRKKIWILWFRALHGIFWCPESGCAGTRQMSICKRCLRKHYGDERLREAMEKVEGGFNN